MMMMMIDEWFQRTTYSKSLRFERLKAKRYGSPQQVISELRRVTCYIESRSVTCHPTQVNAPA